MDSRIKKRTCKAFRSTAETSCNDMVSFSMARQVPLEKGWNPLFAPERLLVHIDTHFVGVKENPSPPSP